MISKLIVRGLVLASALLLEACGTTQFSGYISAPPEAEKVVRAGGYVEEAVAQVAIVGNPDFNGGKISAKALTKIQEYGISCQRQIDAQLSGPGQAALNGALPYGIAGTGTGVAAAAAGFTSAVATAANYAVYGGLAYVLPGAVNGLVSGSYSMASAKGNCTEKFWTDIAKTDPAFAGTHVIVVYAGKRSGGSIPPALDRAAVTNLKPAATPVLDRSAFR